MEQQILLESWLPGWTVATLLLVAVLLGGYLLYRRASGASWRLGLLVLLVLALLDPRLIVENRKPLSDVVLLVEDHTESQQIDDRLQQQADAVEALEERLAAIPDVELRRARIMPSDEGTLALPTIREALAGLDQARLAATIMVSDGQVLDLDEEGQLPAAPLHVLLTGRMEEQDRSLEVDGVPGYALIGEPFSLRALVHDRPETMDQPIELRLQVNGQTIETQQVPAGREATFSVTLNRPGESVIAISARADDREVSTRNNSRYFKINGIRDRLRVLLVSGQPYPGLRVWRNVLKADPTIDLVHFTILRPPEKQDGTPINELALIAFPSRELFEEKLSSFDLVIFDRYARRGLLPLVYLDNVARYVEEGGALLEAAGPEFASPMSLYRTPLARILPGRPTGEIFERRLVPTVTDTGRRHPVTQALLQDEETPDWGPWFRQIDVEVGDAQVLMNGAAERPLLMLKHVGDGRVAQLLSDHAWLWAKGVDGGGPHVTLLRRILHWLMREPELEEEQILGRPIPEGIEIERRSLGPGPGTVRVDHPEGSLSEVRLEPAGEGIWRGRLAADEPGFYRISDGELNAYVAGTLMPVAETSDLRSTDEKLQVTASRTGGSVRWLDAGLPALRPVSARSTTRGSGWIGLRRNEMSLLESRSQAPLLPPPLAFALLIGTAALAWWREGRG